MLRKIKKLLIVLEDKNYRLESL